MSGFTAACPRWSASARQGSGRSNTTGGPGRPQGTTVAHRAPELTASPGALRGAGASQATIPAPYRRRVADYFERIADELGDR